MDKAASRQWAIQTLSECSEDQRAEGSDAVVRRLRDLPEFQSAETIIGYLATVREFDLSDLWQGVLESRVLGMPAEHHQLRRLHDLEQVERNSIGVLQPMNAGTAPLHDRDVLIMPGLAFDRAGYRLGHGTGYYDRLIPDLTAKLTLVGVCYDWQIVDELPHEHYDQPAHLLVTPTQTIDLRT